MEIHETLIQAKENYLRTLFKKYEAAYNQKAKNLNDAEQISIDENIKQLESEIGLIQGQINDLRKSQIDENDKYRDVLREWEDKLHKIDFSKVESTLKPILSNLRRQEGSALFILRKSRSMGGKWCIQKVKYRIQEDLGVLVAPCDIGFSAFQKVEPVAFLNRLAERFKVDIHADQNNIYNCSQTIIDHIFDSLTSGNIFLMDVNIYTLTQKDTFLEWFVNDFWVPLVSRLPTISSQKRKIRLIAILAVQDSIPKACLPSTICCKKKDFDGGKILELPLQKWTKDEISDWLFDFSGLTAQSMRLTDDAITQMAQNIHQVTKGLPNDVYHELMEAMTQCAC